jgi:regulator of cell morphogenesis and NO signaling
MEDAMQETVPAEVYQSWRNRPLPELVEHIVNDFHHPLGVELPQLLTRSAALRDRHTQESYAAELEDLHEILKAIWSEVENHIEAEEQVVFPWILSHVEGEGNFEEPFSSIRHDHNFVYRALSRLRQLTTNFSRLPGDDPEGAELAQRFEKLDRDLRHHQRLEEEILFPRARGESL